MEPSIFGHVLAARADPMFELKVRLDHDASSEKIDLGAGVYRDEDGAYDELEVVKEVCVTEDVSDWRYVTRGQAKDILSARNPGHDVGARSNPTRFDHDCALVRAHDWKPRVFVVRTMYTFWISLR